MYSLPLKEVQVVCEIFVGDTSCTCSLCSCWRTAAVQFQLLA